MGKRRFRLSHRKNYEQKKYDKDKQLIVSVPLSSISVSGNPSTPFLSPEPSSSTDSSSSVTVSIPISHYLNATVTDSKVLLEKILAYNVLPSGWTILKETVLLGGSFPL